MAIVSHRIGYLFIHAPRTGGTALTDGVLVPRLDGTRIPRQGIAVRTPKGEPRMVRQHVTRAQLLEAGLLSAEEADRLFTFTTVRNPFDSLVSAYLKKRDSVPGKSWAGNHPVTKARVAAAAELAFPDYVETQFGSRRPHHLYGRQIDGAAFVMRFEHLQGDFEQVLARLGIGERIEIPRINSTARDSDYRVYYTPESRAVVERVFAPDLERFGYEF